MGCSHETVRGCYDFASDFHCLQGSNEGQGAVGKKTDVLDTEIVCQSFFKFPVIESVVRQPFPIPYVLKHGNKVFQLREKWGGDCDLFFIHAFPKIL